MEIFVSATISNPVPPHLEHGLVVPLLVSAEAMTSRLFFSILFASLFRLAKRQIIEVQIFLSNSKSWESMNREIAALNLDLSS